MANHLTVIGYSTLGSKPEFTAKPLIMYTLETSDRPLLTGKCEKPFQLTATIVFPQLPKSNQPPPYKQDPAESHKGNSYHKHALEAIQRQHHQ